MLRPGLRSRTDQSWETGIKAKSADHEKEAGRAVQTQNPGKCHPFSSESVPESEPWSERRPGAKSPLGRTACGSGRPRDPVDSHSDLVLPPRSRPLRLRLRPSALLWTLMPIDLPQSPLIVRRTESALPSAHDKGIWLSSNSSFFIKLPGPYCNLLMHSFQKQLPLMWQQPPLRSQQPPLRSQQAPLGSQQTPHVA